MRKLYIFAGFITLAAIAKLFLAPSGVPVIWKVPVKGLSSELAIAPDGTIYVSDSAGGALTAYDRQGRLKWTSPSSVYVDSVPVIGRDGTIYVRGKLKPFSISEIKALVALNPDGSEKWTFPINEIVASDASSTSFALGTNDNDTLYFRVGGDFFSPKTLYAVSAVGRELWHFGSDGNMTAPVVVSDDESVLFHSAGKSNASLYRLSTTGISQGESRQLKHSTSSFSVDWDGTAYLSGEISNTFGDPYKVLYCLDVGVGLATNSPWPMQGADVRLTRHVAPRIPASPQNP